MKVAAVVPSPVPSRSHSSPREETTAAQNERPRLCSQRPWQNPNAQWWYSTVHLTVAIIGAGVVGLPRALQHLGWWPGMLMLGATFIITVGTTWLIIQLHDLPGHGPLDTYADLGRLLGIRGGRTFMLVLQIVVEVTANIAYMVTGGLALKILFHSESKDYLWILIFGICQAGLSLFASFASLTIVNLIGTLTAIGYCTIIWTSARAVSPQVQPAASKNAGSNFFEQSNAIGVIAFALGGQIIQLNIQGSMASTSRRPSKHPMWNGVVVSYIIVAACYFPVAAVGYKIFKHHCYNNFFEIILKGSRLQHNETVHRAVDAALVMLATHLLGSYQIYALPIYELLEYHFGKVSPMLLRSGYVGLTCLVAILFPSFNEILGITGGFALAPTSYIMPCVIWMIVRRPRAFSPAWIANLVVIGFGATVMVVAVVGGFKTIVKHRMFHFPHDCGNSTLSAPPQTRKR